MNANPLTRTESFECDGPAELDIRIRGGRIEVRATDVAHVRVEISTEPGDPRRWEQGVEDLLGTISQGAYTPNEADTHSVAETKIEFSERRRRLVVRAPPQLPPYRPRGRRRGPATLEAEGRRRARCDLHLRRPLRAQGGDGQRLDRLRGCGGAGRRGHRHGSGHARPRRRAAQGSPGLRRARGRLDRGRRRVRHQRTRRDLARGRALRRTRAHRARRHRRRGGGGRRPDARDGSGRPARGRPAGSGGRARRRLGVGTGPQRARRERPSPADAPAARIRMRTGSGEAVVASAAA